ncbi:MAG: two-component system sensor histidine kinase PhoQ [Shewanella sp.]|jgi:two-component system sensor histidine kinase PhoQ
MNSQQTSKSNRLSLLNSLKARLVISALLLILVLMPLIGFTLNDAFKQQVKTAAKNELSAYIYSVLAVTEVENDQLQMPELLLENQFNVIQSGLYALISTPSANSAKTTPDESGADLLWHSDSFLGLSEPKKLPQPLIGQRDFDEIILDGQPHIIYSLSVSFEQEDGVFPITLHIIKDQADFQKQIDQFNRQLWSWLLVLMALLGMAQLAWLLWTLKPLAKFKQELQDVENGKAMQLSVNYPSELQSVAYQLNTLLLTEQNQRKRYRNALSDLAHSLKTPLAVIQSQKGLDSTSIEQVSTINRIIGHQLKRAQSAAGSSWHLGVKIAPISAKLIRTLGKIYREPQRQISADVDPDAIFRGDEADLTEILGNLLDNACKAAKSQILLTVSTSDLTLNISIEDDGRGVSAEQESKIFERGTRADSYEQGHGIGLAIVRDLLDSYNGQLVISRSEALGGAKFLLIFNQKI